MKHILVLCLILMVVVPSVSADQSALNTQHRRPAALALLDGGRTLCVANRRSGTLSLVDVKQHVVVEKQIGQNLSDVLALPDSHELLVSDFSDGSLIVLTHTDGGVEVTSRIAVSAYPESIAVNGQADCVCVASLWSRRVTILSRNSARGQHQSVIKPLHQVDLPFAPRAVEFINSSCVVVADSFGGRLAVLDCNSGDVLALHRLPIHNVRDLMVADDQRLYLTCQRLNPKGYTNREDIHWGILIENEILSVSIESLLCADTENPLDFERIGLGGPGNGAGDPAGIHVTSGHMMVSLAGTDELAIVSREGIREVRLPTESRPTAIAFDSETSNVFVANMLSDSVTVYNLMASHQIASISLGPRPVPGPVERGERAFFSAKLALENWMSCHSCHTDGHTNNGLADTLGDGDFGDAKRVPTLRGVWSTGPWGWNGSQHLLHSQIRNSLTSTMHSSVSDESRITDLTAYVTQLERVPSVAVARGTAPHPTIEYQRRELFESAGCSTCHNGFTSYTTDDTFDVGLSDANGQSQFNPPSLSGVSQRDRFFHDGRAASIEDVLTRFNHPAGNKLSDSDRRIIIGFLRAL